MEVGGNCVELESDGKRLLLDLGRPLNVGMDEDVSLPEVEGLRTGDHPDLLAVLISHSHPDHYGLVEQVPESVPAFIGASAARILQEATFFSPASVERSWGGHFRDGEPLRIGPFAITPLLVDHSAFDAFAFLVEAGGRTLLYSGDLRDHGTDPDVFDRLLSRLPTPIHALLLEGTTIGRAAPETDDVIRSERDVERSVIRICEQAEGMVLSSYSAQNLERLSSLYRATLDSPDRELVLDPYVQALAVAADGGLPHVGLPRTRLFAPLSMRVKIKQSGEFRRLDDLRHSRIYKEDLKNEPERFLLTFRPSMANELERIDCLDGADLIWSMWPGYLEEERMIPFRDFLDRLEIPIHFIHASGHATIEGLQRLAEVAAAERVVPIHTAAPNRYPDFFANVEIRSDGEWWSV